MGRTEPISSNRRSASDSLAKSRSGGGSRGRVGLPALVFRILLACTVLATSGCPAVQRTPEFGEDVLFLEPAPAKNRTVLARNYETGGRYSVGPGEPMVSVKHYTVEEKVARAVALQDFEQLCSTSLGTALSGALEGAPVSCTEGPFAGLRASLGDPFDVPGVMVEDGVPYFALEIPGSGGRGYLLTDAEGVLKEGSYVAWRPDGDSRRHSRGLPHDPVIPGTPLDLNGPVVGYEIEESFVNTGVKYLNYEILFDGLGHDLRGPAYVVRYREYRRDATELPSFEQVLSYPISQSEFEVLGMRIAVHSASAEQISFTVLQDTLPVEQE